MKSTTICGQSQKLISLKAKLLPGILCFIFKTPHGQAAQATGKSCTHHERLLLADFCRSRCTRFTGQILCKRLVKSNAIGWSVAIQTGGRVECNSPIRSLGTAWVNSIKRLFRAEYICFHISVYCCERSETPSKPATEPAFLHLSQALPLSRAFLFSATRLSPCLKRMPATWRPTY